MGIAALETIAAKNSPFPVQAMAARLSHPSVLSKEMPHSARMPPPGARLTQLNATRHRERSLLLNQMGHLLFLSPIST